MNITLVLCGRRDGAQAAALFFLKEGRKFEEKLGVLTGILRIWHEQNRWYEYGCHKLRM